MTSTDTSKTVVLNAYTLLAAQDFDGLAQILREDFTSHNPDIPSGRTAVVEFLRGSPIAETKVDLEHVVAEGDLVAVHYRALGPGDTKSRGVVDLWRVDGELLAEHWDVVQP